jgi:hypothetical protein
MDFKCRGLVSSLGFRMLVNLQMGEFQEIFSIYYAVSAAQSETKFVGTNLLFSISTFQQSMHISHYFLHFLGTFAVL